MSALLGVKVKKDYYWKHKKYRCYAIHGDQWDVSLKNKILNSIIIYLYDLLKSMNKKWSYEISRWFNDQFGVMQRNYKIIKMKAIKLAKENGIKIILTGHTHYPELNVKEGIVYGNSGSWDRGIVNIRLLLELIRTRFIYVCIKMKNIKSLMKLLLKINSFFFRWIFILFFGVDVDIVPSIDEIFSFWEEPRLVIPNDTTGFSNGGYCFQRTKEETDYLGESILKSIRLHEPWIERDFRKIKNVNEYFVGRCLCDSNSKIYSWYLLFDCICKGCYRQYGQSYFSNNCKCDGKIETIIIKRKFEPKINKLSTIE